MSGLVAGLLALIAVAAVLDLAWRLIARRGHRPFRPPILPPPKD